MYKIAHLLYYDGPGRHPAAPHAPRQLVQQDLPRGRDCQILILHCIIALCCTI